MIEFLTENAGKAIWIFCEDDLTAARFDVMMCADGLLRIEV